jgi:hypothetical protein
MSCGIMIPGDVASFRQFCIVNGSKADSIPIMGGQILGWITRDTETTGGGPIVSACFLAGEIPGSSSPPLFLFFALSSLIFTHGGQVWTGR